MKSIVTGIAALGVIFSIATSRAQESLPLPSFGNETQTAPSLGNGPLLPPADNNAPPVPPPPAPVTPPATAPTSPPANNNATTNPPTANTAPLATDNINPPAASSNNRGPVPLASNPNQPAAIDWAAQDATLLDLIALDQLSNRLTAVTRCLCEDAHRMCPNYYPSATIVAYVDQLDRLQNHLHQLVCDAVTTGNYFGVTVGQIQADVCQVRTLIGQLYHELRILGLDGGCGRTHRVMAKMRQTIVQEATPLLQTLEHVAHSYVQFRPPYGCDNGFCPTNQPVYSVAPNFGGRWMTQ